MRGEHVRLNERNPRLKEKWYSTTALKLEKSCATVDLPSVRVDDAGEWRLSLTAQSSLKRGSIACFERQLMGTWSKKHGGKRLDLKKSEELASARCELGWLPDCGRLMLLHTERAGVAAVVGDAKAKREHQQAALQFKKQACEGSAKPSDAMGWCHVDLAAAEKHGKALEQKRRKDKADRAKNRKKWAREAEREAKRREVGRKLEKKCVDRGDVTRPARTRAMAYRCVTCFARNVWTGGCAGWNAWDRSPCLAAVTRKYSHPQDTSGLVCLKWQGWLNDPEKFKQCDAEWDRCLDRYLKPMK